MNVMKKTALILLLGTAAVGMEAQTMYDALRFSENNYEGTARTMAMGNAFTALGGDLGGITINPAGSAVAGYSQITITPGVNISVNNAGGTPLPGETTPLGFGKSMKNSWARFNIPNYGVSLNFDTHRTKGIKNISIGFIANTTNRFQESLMTAGEHNMTSFMGAEAAYASSAGYDFDALLASDAYDYYAAPWRTIMAAQAGMISPLTDYPGIYVGSTERFDIDDTDPDHVNIHTYIGGPLDQSYQRQTSGFKSDYVFNIGFNISDFVYFGANLGITSFNYDSALRYIERAVDPADFENVFNVDGQDVTTYFNDMMYDYRYSATGVGIYGKFGVIVTPMKNLRLGAAIQTPTGMSVTENWSESGSTTFDDPSFNMSSESPLGEYRYRLISPFRANFGAAWTFGTFGLISADYEMCDYSTMKFKELDTMQSGEFDYQNEDIRTFMGTSHMFRAGIEIKPVPQFSIRAGYGLTTSPEKIQDEYGHLVYVSKVAEHPERTMTHKGSFGLGYSSNGSFFADVACSYTRYPNEYIYPYDDYAFDENGYSLTPEIENRRSLWSVMLTVGFRF